MKKIECFKIRILIADENSIWNIEQMLPIHDILCDRHPFSTNPIVIVADPFLFVHREKLFLFYEEKRNYSNGVLKMTCTTDLKTWSKPTKILKEPFHLSYPFVFEENGKIFLIPETSDIGDIRLYKATNDDLNNFTFYKTLIKKDVVETEIGYADTSIFKKDSTFFLMTSIERDGSNIMYLYTSDHIEGPYTEHPCSPVCSSAQYGRNGGCLLESADGKIYRVAQDCKYRYGDDIHLLQVDELTPKTYKEHLVKSNIIPTSIPFYQEGGHQYNIVRFKGRMIVATDAKEYNTYTIYRLWHKSKLTLHELFK